MSEETPRLTSVLLNPALGAAQLLAGLAAVVGSAYISHMRQGMESGSKDPVRCLYCSPCSWRSSKASIKQPKEPRSKEKPFVTINGTAVMTRDPILRSRANGFTGLRGLALS